MRSEHFWFQSIAGRATVHIVCFITTMVNGGLLAYDSVLFGRGIIVLYVAALRSVGLLCRNSCLHLSVVTNYRIYANYVLINLIMTIVAWVCLIILRSEVLLSLVVYSASLFGRAAGAYLEGGRGGRPPPQSPIAQKIFALFK